MFLATLSTMVKIWKQTVSIKGWVDKENVVFMYTVEQYSYIKKKGNLTICDKMDGAWECYAKLNKSEEDKYSMISLIYRI